MSHLTIVWRCRICQYDCLAEIWSTWRKLL